MLPVIVIEGDGSAELEDEGDDVPDPVMVGVGVAVDDIVPLALVVGVILDENEILGVIDALAPTVTELVGDCVDDAGMLGLEVGVEIGVIVGVDVEVGDEVTLLLFVDENEIEPESDPVDEGLAPAVNEAVGDFDNERDSD